MTDPSNWRTHIHLVLTRADSAILMVPSGDAWALPSVKAERRIWWRSAFAVDRLLQAELGPGLVSLRCLSSADVAAECKAAHVYVVEDLDGSFSPSGHAWISSETLADVALAVPDHRAVTNAVLNEVRSGVGPNHAPWWQPGWFEAARQWLERWVEASGEVLYEPVDRYYNWPLASIVRAHTHSDLFYLKASTRLAGMADESDLTARLAAMFPGQVPEPLAVDRERGWFLLRTYKVPIRQVPNDVKLAALLEFAGMQQQSVQHIEELLDMDGLDSTEVRDSYLAEWTTYEPPDRLAQAWALALPLTFLLELMVRYDLGTARGFEPEEAGEAIVETLHKMLRTLDEIQGES